MTNDELPVIGGKPPGWVRIRLPGKNPYPLLDIEPPDGFTEWRFEGKPYSQRGIVSVLWGLFLDGYTTVILEGPTGLGKSLISKAITEITGTDSYILTQFISLQDQYLGDFDDLVDIRGRRHFDCGLQFEGKKDSHQWFGRKADTAPCTYHPRYQGSQRDYMGNVTYRCPVRRENKCEYFTQRDNALAANQTLTNPAYIWSFAMSMALNHDDTLKPRGFAIYDEGHRLISNLVSQLSFTLRRSDWRDWGMDPDLFPEPTGKLVRKQKQWRMRDWILDIDEGPLVDLLDHLRRKIEIDLETVKAAADKKANNLYRRIHNMRNAIESITKIIFSMQEPGQGWIVIQDEAKTIFKPVNIAAISGPMFEQISHRRIIMSATIGAAEILTNDLGLNVDRTAFLQIMESPFPAQNRLIHVEIEHGSMKWQKDHKGPSPRTKRNIMLRIVEIMLLHKDQRGLVLPYNKWFMKEIIEFISTTISEDLPPVDANEKIGRVVWSDHHYRKAVDYFLRYPEENLLLFSTVNEGLDFPGDLAEYLILPKAPNPAAKDPWIEARMKRKDGWYWYRSQAMQTLVQGAGRIVRSSTDVATIYILDRHTWEHIKKNHFIYPRWFLESIRLAGKPPDFAKRDIKTASGKTHKARSLVIQ